MKRLYVKPGFRKLGLGRQLAIRVIDEAMLMGYSRMRLDTLESMREARSLYSSLGFKQIGAYRFNPHDNAVYMELELNSVRRT